MYTQREYLGLHAGFKAGTTPADE